jgi:hypothetical protein
MIPFFILTALCIPALPDGAVIPKWDFLALYAAFLFFFVEFSPLTWAIVAYVTFMAWIGPIGYESALLYAHFWILLILFQYPFDMQKVAMGVGFGILANSIVVLAQYGGWTYIPGLTAESGLFYNRNIAAESAAMGLVLVIGYRLWWLVPGFIPTLVFGSRAPIIALGVCASLYLWRKSPWLSALTLMGGVSFVAIIMGGYGTLGHGGFQTFDVRVGVWLDTIPGLTIFGRGLGAFLVQFPIFQHHSDALTLRFENAHNDFLQLLYDLGIGAIALVITLFVQMWYAAKTPAWYALVVFLVEGCFGFPLYEPVTGALAVVCAGELFGFRLAVYDLLRNGGLRLRPWLENQFAPGLRACLTALSTCTQLQIRSGL